MQRSEGTGGLVSIVSYSRPFLVGAFSVITNLRIELFEALMITFLCAKTPLKAGEQERGGGDGDQQRGDPPQVHAGQLHHRAVRGHGLGPRTPRAVYREQAWRHPHDKLHIFYILS